MITVLVFAQKLLPVRTTIDVPVVPVIVALGILIVISPSYAVDVIGGALFQTQRVPKSREKEPGSKRSDLSRI
jgi:hypothetical protein